MTIKNCTIIFEVIFFFFCQLVMSMSCQIPQDSTLIPRQKEVFIKVSTSKSSVYVGEAFSVSYTLYSASAIIDPQKEVTIKFEHSYQEQYPIILGEREEKIEGRTYRVKVLQQYLVIANTAGKLRIPSLKKAIQRSQIDKNDFFGQEQLITQMLVSNSELITIKPLPHTEETNLFSHAVGDFTIKGGYQPVDKGANLLEFNLILEGIGNTKNCLFTPPQSNNLWDIYNVTTTIKDTLESSGLKTRVGYSFQIATNYNGTFTIPAFTFTVFNPKTNSYQKFNTGLYEWKVIQAITSLSKPTLNKKILIAKERIQSSTGTIFSYSALYYVIVGLGFLLLLYVYFEDYIVIQWNYFQQYRSRKKALSIALLACRQQLILANSIAKDVLYQNATSILLEYIHHKKGESLMLALVQSDSKKIQIDCPIEIRSQLEEWWDCTQEYRFGINKITYDPKAYIHQLEALLLTLDSHEYV